MKSPQYPEFLKLMKNVNDQRAKELVIKFVKPDLLTDLIQGAGTIAKGVLRLS
jgi:hypothetical protein